MPLTPEQEWTIVACGLVAHADDVLEVGEWDQILRMVDAHLSADESSTWLELVLDRAALEKRFEELQPPLPAFAEDLLHQAWRMALADGDGSAVEAAVHDRIADHLGIDGDRAAEMRDEWTERAGKRAEVVVAFAAAMANVDGRMDSAEAVQFDALMENLPLPVSRKLELAELLYNPPSTDSLAGLLSAMPIEEREAVLRDLVPVVNAAHRGDRERALYFELADRAAISRDRAQHLLQS